MILKTKMNTRKYCASKLLEKLKHCLQSNTLWFFSDKKRFCADQIQNSQINCWLDVPIGIKKIKHPVRIKVFVAFTGDGDVMSLFIISQNGLHQVFGGDSATPASKWWLQGSPTLGNRTFCHATHVEELSLACKKILKPHNPKHLSTLLLKFQPPWLSCVERSWPRDQ